MQRKWKDFFSNFTLKYQIRFYNLINEKKLFINIFIVFNTQATIHMNIRNSIF